MGLRLEKVKGAVLPKGAPKVVHEETRPVIPDLDLRAVRLAPEIAASAWPDGWDRLGAAIAEARPSRTAIWQPSFTSKAI